MGYQLKPFELFCTGFYIVLHEAWIRPKVKYGIQFVFSYMLIQICRSGNFRLLMFSIPFLLFLLVRTSMEYHKRKQEGWLEPVGLIVEEKAIKIVSSTIYECPFSSITGVQECMGMIFITWGPLIQQRYIPVPMRMFSDSSQQMSFVRYMKEVGQREKKLQKERLLGRSVQEEERD